MHKLKHLQNAFYQAIFQENSHELSLISSNYPAERLNIYRQTIFENMSSSLSITFPGIWKILGKECADNSAYIFCKEPKNLPYSGNLDDWGEEFIEFLGSQKELQTLVYLKDYARYEWLKHKAYGAESAKTINLGDLGNVPEQLIESIKLTFLPSVFIFFSNFPLFEIEEIVENSKAESITLSTNKAHAVIARLNNQVITFWLAEDLWLFINSLKQNLNLAQAAEKTQKLYPDFALAEALHFLLQNQLIHKINLT